MDCQERRLTVAGPFRCRSNCWRDPPKRFPYPRLRNRSSLTEGTFGDPRLDRESRSTLTFTDPRIWGTQLYFLLMLPLGILYFTLAVTGLSVSLSLIASPIALLFGFGTGMSIDGNGLILESEPWAWPLAMAAGVVILFGTLHLARAIGAMHGALAKHMLVKSAQYS